MPIYLIHVLNGLAYGSVLGLIAAGLALIFGFMGVVNFAHGALYMLGAYLGYAIANLTGSFLLALILAPVAVAIVGLIFQRLVLDRLQEKTAASYILVTFGFTLVLENLIRIVWGPSSHSFETPALLASSVNVLGQHYPAYRLFLIALVVLVGGSVYLLINRTSLGRRIRAVMEDGEMALVVGINAPVLSLVVFSLGMILAGIAGVAVGPYLTVEPTMGVKFLTDAFIVVAVAGMRNFLGALVTGLLMGIVQTLGSVLYPSLSLTTVYLIMIIALVVKPHGLFSRADARH